MRDRVELTRWAIRRGPGEALAPSFGKWHLCVDTGVAAPWGAHLIVDLRALDFIECLGLRELVRAQERADRGGWALSLIAGPAAARLIELTRAERELTLLTTPE